MSDKSKPRPSTSGPLRPLDADPDASVRLIDQLHNEAADAALRDDGPPSEAAIRLAAWGQSLAAPHAGDVSDGRPVTPLEDPAAIDTARIARMERGSLEQLAARLCAQGGEPAMPSLAALTDDELRAVVRRLRPSARHV